MPSDVSDPDRQATASIELSGEIDLSNAPAIGKRLIERLTPGGELRVDFSEVTFIDSQGIAMMVGVHDQATSGGGRVVWDGIRPQALRVLQITNLDTRLDIRLADG